MNDIDVIKLFASVTGRPELDFEGNKTLAELGVDSMGILRFIISLESEHGIEIDGNSIGEIANGSIADISRTINSARAAG